MLADKVLFQWLVCLSSQLDSTVHQVHLVDEQITENSRTGYNNIDTRTSKHLKRNQLNLVHTSKRIRYGFDSNKSQYLGQRLPVGLDIISSPQGESNTLGVHTLVIIPELLQKLPNNSIRHLNSSCGWDGRRIQSMHVTSGRKNIRVTDGISTRGRHQKLSVQQLHNSSKLVVSNNLLQAELQVSNQGHKTRLLNLGETSIDDCLSPGLLLSHKTSEEVTNLIESTLYLLHTSVRVSGLIHKSANCSTSCQGNLVVEFNFSQNSLVVSTVDFVDVTTNG
mmetsp:Transcript_23287/g.34498  ORF Transcript_23287/g.34498 Transcript_23287/m.34498 type:complete len:279 (+) Transcript_23287:901-1737(+)